MLAQQLGNEGRAHAAGAVNERGLALRDPRGAQSLAQRITPQNATVGIGKRAPIKMHRAWQVTATRFAIRRCAIEFFARAHVENHDIGDGDSASHVRLRRPRVESRPCGKRAGRHRETRPDRPRMARVAPGRAPAVEYLYVVLAEHAKCPRYPRLLAPARAAVATDQHRARVVDTGGGEASRKGVEIGGQASTGIGTLPRVVPVEARRTVDVAARERKPTAGVEHRCGTALNEGARRRRVNEAQ